MDFLEKKNHKHRRHHRHHKTANKPEMSANPPTAQTILSSHFKKPFIDIQSLGLIDPLGSSLSYLYIIFIILLLLMF